VKFEIGFPFIDRLTALMMVVVTFVSWMVHIYTVGWHGGRRHLSRGYQRFFSHISLFTFFDADAGDGEQLSPALLWLGSLVSYLLIGYYYRRPTAIYANLKAFLVNRGRLRLPARRRVGAQLLRHARLRRGVRRGAEDGEPDHGALPGRNG
jgi:NADH-quinone oxidoreductase subunit L